MQIASSMKTTLAVALFCAATSAVAQPSSNVFDYVLFAEEMIKTKGLDVSSGDIGVNADEGRLLAPRFLFAPTSNVAADRLRFGLDPLDYSFGTLYGNVIEHGNVLPTAFTPPIVGSIGAACGFPGVFPTCDENNDFVQPSGTSGMLAPGVYGSVNVRSTAAFPTTLTLPGGVYVMCDLKVGRLGQVQFTGPAQVYIRDALSAGVLSYFGPGDPSVQESDIEVFVAGKLVKFTRESTARARVCAPNATLRMSQGGSHQGTFVANFIRTEEILLGLGSPSGAFLAE